MNAMQTEKPEGAKYVRGRDVAETAKLIRAELKAMLPKGAKATVRIDRYSMGRSLTVAITPPAGFVVHSLKRLRHEIEHPHRSPFTADGSPILRHSDAARALVASVEAMVRTYNRDSSDLVSDYHNVDFHASVDFDSAFEQTQRVEIERTLRAAGVGRKVA